MVAIPFVTGSLPLDDDRPTKALMTGLGGGSIENYLRSRFRKIHLTSVEIDPIVVHLAKNYFGIVESERHSVIVEDAVKYIAHKAAENEHFDAIFLDICPMERQFIPCPIEEFRTAENIALLRKLLGENGTLTVNLVFFMQMDELRTNPTEPKKFGEIIKMYFKIFEWCKIVVAEEANIVLACAAKEPKDYSMKLGYVSAKLGIPTSKGWVKADEDYFS
ncbi:hypothetical protein AB6A40_002177 [Gnathostoma spinigerum]|uniref:PABS domain-containing protein n=1 Tax=Gnathostoma spinigerum TaxID=75299 RepID=A0ABD6E622_9BILA